MTRRSAHLLLLGVLIACALVLWPRSGQGATTSEGGSSASGRDREFVTTAAQSSWAEIAMGELAQKKGQSDAVRQFGQRMVQDHTAATKVLQSIAGKLGVRPPKEPDPKHQGDVKALAQANGAEFDRLYAGYMVRDHERAVSLFEKQAKSGDNAELRQFAAKQLPVMQEHLKLARSLPAQR